MGVKFTACYPELSQGVRTPCGIVLDREDGSVREIICPELSADLCAQLAEQWNAREAGGQDRKNMEEELGCFISAALSARSSGMEALRG